MNDTQLARARAPYTGRHRVGESPDTPSPPVPVALRDRVAPADFQLPVGPHDDVPSHDPFPWVPEEVNDLYDAPAGDLDLLLDSADLGPGKKPLMGNPAKPRHALRVLAGFGLVTACLISVGTIVGGTLVVATAKDGETISTYTRPGGTAIDLRGVTCPMLSRDVITSGRKIVNSPMKRLPLKLHGTRPVIDNLGVVAELPEGEALICRSTGIWPRGVLRDVTVTLSVTESTSSMDTTLVTAALR